MMESINTWGSNLPCKEFQIIYVDVLKKEEYNSPLLKYILYTVNSFQRVQ